MVIESKKTVFIKAIRFTKGLCFMGHSKLELMESAPVRKAILTLAIPTVLTTIVQLIYNLTDTFFIGLLDDPNQLAAISLAFPVFMLIQSVGNMFAIGAPSYISRKLGAKEFDKAKKTCSVAFYTSIGAGVLLTLIYFLFQGSILNAIGTSPATLGPTTEYMTIIAGFSVVLMLQIVMPGLLRAEGATKQSMIGMMLGTVLNIILDPVFIFVFHMGVGGAAWATIIGNVCAVIYFLQHYLRKKAILTVGFSEFKPSRAIYSNIFKIGLPATISQAIMSLSFIVSNVLASGYGDYVIAAQGVSSKAFSMVVMISIGFAQGFQPFAGYNFGAKNYHRVIEAYKLTIIYGTAICIAFAAGFLLFAEPFMRAFTSNAEVIGYGVKMMHASVWAIPIFALQMTNNVMFQATGQAVKAMLVGLGRQLIVFLPLLFLLNSLFGFNGFIYSQPAADIVTTTLAVSLAIPFLRDLRKKDKMYTVQPQTEQTAHAIETETI